MISVNCGPESCMEILTSGVGWAPWVLTAVQHYMHSWSGGIVIVFEDRE